MKLTSIFANADLAFDLEKIKNFDTPITISKSYDDNLDLPFGIDVEDSSYFYTNEAERDLDYNRLSRIIKPFLNESILKVKL